MTVFFDFFVMAATAMFLENGVFSRALGASRMLQLVRHRKDFVRFCAILTGMTTVSAAIVYPLSGFLREHGVPNYYWALFYVIIVSALYSGVYWASKRFFPNWFGKAKRLIGLATFNHALLGALFLGSGQNFSFVESVGFGLGSGIGFLLATLLVYEGKRRLELCSVPKAFRGFPVTMLYLGIVAMAMYGLVGHKLPY